MSAEMIDDFVSAAAAPPAFGYAEPESEDCEVTYNGRTYRNGDSFQVQLNALEAFQLQAKCDLTGTSITATRPVSVFSGNARTAIGPGAITRDHLVEQVPPVNTWGKTFVTIPTPKRTVGDYWKIVSSQDGTQVTISGTAGVKTQTRTLGCGEHWQIDIPCQDMAYIKANNPILVAKFVKSQTVGTEKADPAMLLSTPLEQFGSGYTFHTVEGVATTYSNLMTIAVNKGAENSLMLDGAPVRPVEGWKEIPGSNVMAGYVNLRPGSHHIASSGSECRFATYIYGAGDRESYAYPTGMCMRSLANSQSPYGAFSQFQ